LHPSPDARELVADAYLGLDMNLVAGQGPAALLKLGFSFGALAG
jgi:hypothetical protein